MRYLEKNNTVVGKQWVKRVKVCTDEQVRHAACCTVSVVWIALR